MMNFNIIIPFSRPNNAAKIIDDLALAREGMRGQLRIHAVCHESDQVKLWENAIESKSPEGWDLCYGKCNVALEILTKTYNAADECFAFLCDDDAYEKWIFRDIENAMEKFNAKVAVISSHRWGHSGVIQHDLLATPENMRRCQVGVEQFFIRADVMKNYRFINSEQADGELMERLKNDIGNEFVYLPALFVNWNILSP